MSITIAGLGPGRAEDITRRVWSVIEQADTVVLRTERHPCVPDLPIRGTRIACDDLYEAHAAFADVYAAIVQRVIGLARDGAVVYAVPGDPAVGESTTAMLIDAARAAGIGVEILPGISFIEPTLALVGVDGIDGIQLLDALVLGAMHHPPINSDAPALISQVYSRQVASDVKLTLMNQYPDEFEVVLVHAAGSMDAHVERLPLYEIDRSAHISHRTSLFVPALGDMSSFERFQEIIAHLRAPEGCPWDKEQTHESLRRFIVEETHEVLDAIDRGDWSALAEELGDVLLQVVLHTQIAIDDGEFQMSDVLRAVNHKMIRRHPHVFGDAVANNPDQVVTNWEAIKQEEKQANGNPQPASILGGIPVSLAPLAQSYQLQHKAGKVGFDWPNIVPVSDKLREELDEFLKAETPDDRLKELGDILFVVVNLGRHVGIDDPETALRLTNLKFRTRFQAVEDAVLASGRPWADFTLDELDAFWNAAKARG
ncbi:MAG: nucleoside triphosphate pyrophosphohydrolase [Chloroflexi bacterium]|nr:nucleoside triphosphate pyrophosphohydrolase [Chloroflexota bacterium]